MMARTILKFPEDLRKKVEKVCEDIRKRDSSFAYEVDDNVIIFSDNKKQAFARGMWFRKNVSMRIKFEVVE
ncbi:hypothetical protein J7J18_00200 [bacterium]|nr:hypothetical protein [bacterium]